MMDDTLRHAEQAAEHLQAAAESIRAAYAASTGCAELVIQPLLNRVVDLKSDLGRLIRAMSAETQQAASE